jgi:hypothetical protein
MCSYVAILLAQQARRQLPVLPVHPILCTSTAACAACPPQFCATQQLPVLPVHHNSVQDNSCLCCLSTTILCTRTGCSVTCSVADSCIVALV